MTDNNKAADIRAHEIGDQQRIEEAREKAVLDAIKTLWASGEVKVSDDSKVTVDQILELCVGEDETECIQKFMQGNGSPLQELYFGYSFNILYDYADYLIKSDSMPF